MTLCLTNLYPQIVNIKNKKSKFCLTNPDKLQTPKKIKYKDFLNLHTLLYTLDMFIFQLQAPDATHTKPRSRQRPSRTHSR